MKRSMTEIVAGLVLAVSVACSMQVMAETEEINPIRVKTRQINAYGPNPIQIMGTNVAATAAELNIMDGCTATAAKLNAAGEGATATITPTTCTVSNTLTASKKFVQTGETITLTGGNFALTPTNNTFYVAGHYGVVTMSLASAASEMTIRIINTVGTNVVFSNAGSVKLPTGYTAITNAQYDSITFTSWSTNWICTGWQQND